MNVNAGLISSLTKIANHFVTRMKTKIDNVNAPKVIKDAISISPANISADVGSIDVIIDLKKAPMAAAYEWGSGIYGKEGKEYRIPSEGNEIWKTSSSGKDYVLAFPISRWPKYVPPPNVSLATFPGAISRKPYVMHPGVAPRPYIEPTLIAELPKMKEMVGEEVKAQILIGLKEMFRT